MKQRKTVPFWVDDFREELEGKTIDAGILLWYMSAACFALRTPQSMFYLDPYFGGDPVECTPNTYRTTAVPLDPSQISLCDAVFISHAHYDHTHEDSLQAMAKSTKATFYGPISAVKEMVSYGIPDARIHEVKAGDRLQVNDMAVTVFAGHDKDEPQAVTYLYDTNGVRTFFGGDTHFGPTLEEVGSLGELDIAMLAFGRTWYMNEAGLLNTADTLSPRLLLPYHWELWRSHTGDPLEMGRLIERRRPAYETELLLLGDYLHYQPDGTYTRGL